MGTSVIFLKNIKCSSYFEVFKVLGGTMLVVHMIGGQRKTMRKPNLASFLNLHALAIQVDV